jgi:hypothetical protein
MCPFVYLVEERSGLFPFTSQVENSERFFPVAASVDNDELGLLMLMKRPGPISHFNPGAGGNDPSEDPKSRIVT